MTKKKIVVIAIMSCVLSISFTAWAEGGWLKDKLNSIKSGGFDSLKETKLSDTKIGQGLKEALKVGVTNAVKATGKTDGYFKNEAIKLVMPEKLKTLEKGLRMVGFGNKLDEFVLSMNRAAEKAAPAAESIFLDALFDMTIDDVQKLYKGGNTAATDYFKTKTRAKLATAFQPAVDKALKEYGVTNKYKELTDKYKTIPLAQKFSVPAIDDYVINEALDGLFYVLGEEEKKIRTDPKARVTDLLKDVFK